MTKDEIKREIERLRAEREQSCNQAWIEYRKKRRALLTSAGIPCPETAVDEALSMTSTKSFTLLYTPKPKEQPEYDDMIYRCDRCKRVAVTEAVPMHGYSQNLCHPCHDFMRAAGELP